MFHICLYAYPKMFANRVKDPLVSRPVKAQRATLVLAHAANDQGASNERSARDITFVCSCWMDRPGVESRPTPEGCLFVSSMTAYVLGTPGRGRGDQVDDHLSYGIPPWLLSQFSMC